jgi:hypothetical protein
MVLVIGRRRIIDAEIFRQVAVVGEAVAKAIQRAGQLGMGGGKSEAA